MAVASGRLSTARGPCVCLWDLTIVLTYGSTFHAASSEFTGKQCTSTETYLSVCSGLFSQLVVSSPSSGLLDKQRTDMEKWDLSSLHQHSLWLQQFKTPSDHTGCASSYVVWWQLLIQLQRYSKASSSFKTISFSAWRMDEPFFAFLGKNRTLGYYVEPLSSLTGVWTFIYNFCQLLVSGFLEAPLETFLCLLRTIYLSIFVTSFWKHQWCFLLRQKWDVTLTLASQWCPCILWEFIWKMVLSALLWGITRFPKTHSASPHKSSSFGKFKFWFSRQSNCVMRCAGVDRAHRKERGFLYFNRENRDPIRNTDEISDPEQWTR